MRFSGCLQFRGLIEVRKTFASTVSGFDPLLQSSVIKLAEIRKHIPERLSLGSIGVDAVFVREDQRLVLLRPYGCGNGLGSTLGTSALRHMKIVAGFERAGIFALCRHIGNVCAPLPFRSERGFCG